MKRKKEQRVRKDNGEELRVWEREKRRESEGGLKNGYGSKKKNAPRETNWR